MLTINLFLNQKSNVEDQSFQLKLYKVKRSASCLDKTMTIVFAKIKNCTLTTNKGTNPPKKFAIQVLSIFCAKIISSVKVSQD